MPVLEWRDTARADLLAIVDYISDDNPDAAQRLKDEIEAKVARLLEHAGNASKVELPRDLHRTRRHCHGSEGAPCGTAMAAHTTVSSDRR